MSSLALSNQDNNSEVSFFTKLEDGESGMTVTALGKFCGVAQHVITEILNRIRDSDPIVNKLPECLKPFAGKEQRVVVNKEKNSLYVKDELCHAVLQYYTFEAREYQGKDIAIQNYQTFAKAGVRVFIWSKTGYQPPSKQLEPEDRVNQKYLAHLENNLTVEKQFGNSRDVQRASRQIAAYLTKALGLKEVMKAVDSRNIRVSKPAIDHVRVKIFQDLIKACKGKPQKIGYFRNHHLGRRLDVRGLYGVKGEPWLKKIGIVALFTDAAKHGYGSFDPVENVFKPSVSVVTL